MNSINLIKPSEFVSMPWKNGLGTTIELLKKDGDKGGFDWRLSMADVTEDGAFSDFSGYDRCLVLLQGKGISLHSETGEKFQLHKQLDAARFKGEDKITASLHDGPIRDFNIMTNRQICQAQVTISDSANETMLEFGKGTNLIYAVDADLQLLTDKNPATWIPAGHLLAT